ncbi:Enoyl-CoA hydratase [Acidilobus saccharovorans 345-15]|uniref:Enoyl-CoA hydratase n=1 Tax=Acidilobus saccharovorans (strain DSM 16705 / JCM 18335 / VKM B-2471 / 345-15) TaxID=666510 RepID=D9PZU6_ACIS3|nr:enoyl-CoA hydratase/isomerase family protein [Acidilobus saccharovorans]ADL18584.1 Enoyl-CoA hydratase [Acidilobus saccharovorans 345-15]
MSTYVYGENYKNMAYRITINRPEKLNAINGEMWDSLARELEKGCATDLRSILLTGSEVAFSAGDDIDAMSRLSTQRESEEFFNRILDVVTTMIKCNKPIVCAVKGLAAGGGAELLLACDVVVAAENAWISFPEVALGLLPPFLLSLGVTALGHRKARYLAMTGQRLSATEASLLGIVDEVVPQADVDQTVDDILSTLMSFPPQALQAIKRLALSDVDLSRMKEATGQLASLAMTDEAKERMRLFKEHKLKPAAVRKLERRA